MYYANPEARATQARLRLEQWRKILMQTDAAGPRYADETICELLGSASVAAMAEIESFMRDLVESIINTINEAKCPISSLRPELHILHAHTTFDSIRKLESRSNSYWQSRINVTQLHFSQDTALLPGPSTKNPQPPLRGNTIALRDISDIATILCFPHSPSVLLNSPQIAALRKLSGYRNSFAHATVAPREIFPKPRREISKIIDDIDRISDVLDLLSNEWKAVTAGKLFLTSAAL